MSSTAPDISTGHRPTPAVTLTAVPSPPAAMVELERVLAVFRVVNRSAKDMISDARLQQLEWVASELRIALPLGLTETAGDSLAELLAPEAVYAYLLLGRRGFLRTMPMVSTDPTSVDSSERIRIFCLEFIARQAHIPFATPDLPPWVLRPTVSPRYADLITDQIEGEAQKWTEADRPDTIVRSRAMWAVMRDVLPRLGELEEMRIHDLNDSGAPRTLTIVRRPQGGFRGKMPEPEPVPLAESTVSLLDDWLERRTRLTERLTGGTPTHLWLSTPPHPDAGVPIHARGISRWYKKVADAVQIQQDKDGVPESDLVPTRWERMRRTLLAERQAHESTA
ncbi:hypothetical protein ACIO3O_36895 [Streptomyces sp. NPDC087440]|uniref:hypothetical protein n=1 Tax=Streptomyces sp. NPDC087440 TaxID=3365790 RepID=UPI00380F2B1F